MELVRANVCQLYNKKRSTKDINRLRYEMYHTKYANENKAIHMSALPPCRSVLRLHADRANFITAMWKRSDFQNIDAPEITSHG